MSKSIEQEIALALWAKGIWVGNIELQTHVDFVQEIGKPPQAGQLTAIALIEGNSVTYPDLVDFKLHTSHPSIGGEKTCLWQIAEQSANVGGDGMGIGVMLVGRVDD